MKIGFVAHNLIPGNVGGSIHSMELSRGLASIGEEVHLYGQLEEELPDIKNIHFHNYPSSGKAIPGAFKRFLKEFRNYDVIYERFGYLFNNLGFIISKILKKPYVLEVHGFPVNELKIIWKEEKFKNLRKLTSPSMLTALITPLALLRWIENGIFKHNSLIIVTSEGTRDILIKRGVSSDKIKVVPNAVDPNKFNPLVEPENLKDDKETVVTFTGSLFNEAVDVIIEAAEILKDENVKFVVVGPGPLNYYEKIIGMKKVSNVSFYGPVPHDRVPRILAGSDILLALYSTSASRFSEGFHYSPIKVFEYLSMEKPTITIKVKQLELYFRNGENVFFVYPDSPRDLTERILYIMNHKEKAGEVAKNGRILILQNHTWEKRAKILRRYLRSVIT